MIIILVLISILQQITQGFTENQFMYFDWDLIKIDMNGWKIGQLNDSQFINNMVKNIKCELIQHQIQETLLDQIYIDNSTQMVQQINNDTFLIVSNKDLNIYQIVNDKIIWKNHLNFNNSIISVYVSDDDSILISQNSSQFINLKENNQTVIQNDLIDYTKKLEFKYPYIIQPFNDEMRQFHIKQNHIELNQSLFRLKENINDFSFINKLYYVVTESGLYIFNQSIQINSFNLSYAQIIEVQLQKDDFVFIMIQTQDEQNSTQTLQFIHELSSNRLIWTGIQANNQHIEPFLTVFQKLYYVMLPDFYLTNKNEIWINQKNAVGSVYFQQSKIIMPSNKLLIDKILDNSVIHVSNNKLQLTKFQKIGPSIICLASQETIKLNYTLIVNQYQQTVPFNYTSHLIKQTELQFDFIAKKQGLTWILVSLIILFSIVTTILYSFQVQNIYLLL